MNKIKPPNKLHKLPIYAIEKNFSNYPICLWCQIPLEQVGPITSTIPPVIKSKRYACLNHPYDIVYTFKKIDNVAENLKEDWFVFSIVLNISPILRLFYHKNKMVSLHKCLGESSNWGHVTLLNDKTHDESHWTHSLNYDNLTNKVKGYLPFL